MAHENRHQFCPHDFAEKAQISPKFSRRIPGPLAGLRKSRTALRIRKSITWRKKRERLVQRAIRSLRPDIRGVLEMQHSQDYSVEEIARVMSISVGAVKGRLFHARKALRRAPSLRNIGGSKFRARRTTTRSRTGDG